MGLEQMVQAARNGKINEFESAFNAVMAQRTMQRIEDRKVELGNTGYDGDRSGEE